MLLSFLVLTSAFGCRESESGGNVKPITLEVWGVFDSQRDLANLFGSYKQKRSEVTINYRSIALEDYEKILLHGLSEDQGPDVFLIHNRSLPKFRNKIAPMPEDKFTLQQFQDTFVSVAGEDLVYEEQIYGMPLYVDSLAMLWNYDHYRATELGRPQQDMKSFILELEALKQVKSKKVERASIAWGTSENVDQAADILLHLFQQSGVDFFTLGDTKVDITNKDAVKAFDLYTSFAKTSSPNYTWNETMNDDVYEFIKGNVSTIVGYSYLVEQVAVQARTSGLDFRVSSFPQKNPKSPVYFADYWAYTVGKSDDETKVRYGWDLLIHLTEKDSMETYFDTVKRPPSRRDLLSSYEDDPMYGPYVQQARYAKSMITYDKTQYDTSLETAIQKVINKEQKSLKALQGAADEMNKVIELYSQ